MMKSVAPAKVHSPTKTLFLLASTHHTTPIEIREQLALNPESVEEFYDALQSVPSLSEVLVLNTCNRIEIYGVADDNGIRQVLADMFFRFRGIESQDFEPYLFWKTGEEVVEHIFKVSAGVDSQMVGETEILGQVKESYALAQRIQAVGPILNRIFQRSFKEAKWARTHTGISRGQISIGNVAVELATRIFGELGESRILVIGSGEVAEKTVQALVSRGNPFVTVTSRTFARAESLAAAFHGSAIHFDDFPGQLHRFDILICSTASRAPILSADHISRALAQRPRRPFFVIDLAVPRDTEAGAGDLDNVFLYNLDDLAEIANQNLLSRMEEVEEVSRTFVRRARTLWVSFSQRGWF